MLEWCTLHTVTTQWCLLDECKHEHTVDWFFPYSMMLAPLTSYCHTACNHLLSTCPLLSVDLESVSRLLDGTINVLHKIYPLDTAAVAHKGKRLQCKSQRSTGELSHAQSRSSASALKSETGEEYWAQRVQHAAVFFFINIYRFMMISKAPWCHTDPMWQFIMEEFFRGATCPPVA